MLACATGTVATVPKEGSSDGSSAGGNGSVDEPAPGELTGTPVCTSCPVACVPYRLSPSYSAASQTVTPLRVTYLLRRCHCSRSLLAPCATTPATFARQSASSAPGPGLTLLAAPGRDAARIPPATASVAVAAAFATATHFHLYGEVARCLP